MKNAEQEADDNLGLVIATENVLEEVKEALASTQKTLAEEQEERRKAQGRAREADERTGLAIKRMDEAEERAAGLMVELSSLRAHESKRKKGRSLVSSLKGFVLGRRIVNVPGKPRQIRSSKGATTAEGSAGDMPDVDDTPDMICCGVCDTLLLRARLTAVVRRVDTALSSLDVTVSVIVLMF